MSAMRAKEIGISISFFSRITPSSYLLDLLSSGILLQLGQLGQVVDVIAAITLVIGQVTTGPLAWDDLASRNIKHCVDTPAVGVGNLIATGHHNQQKRHDGCQSTVDFLFTLNTVSPPL